VALRLVHSTLALDSGPFLSVLLLGKTVYSHSASLYLDVQMGTSNLNA